MQEFTITQIDKRPSIGSETNSNFNGTGNTGAAGVLVFNNNGNRLDIDNPYAVAGPVATSTGASGRLTPRGHGNSRQPEFIIRHNSVPLTGSSPATTSKLNGRNFRDTPSAGMEDEGDDRQVVLVSDCETELNGQQPYYEADGESYNNTEMHVANQMAL